MKRSATAIIAVIATLLFSAIPELTRPAQAQAPAPCEGLEEWPLLVEGVAASEFVAGLRAENNVAAFIRNQPPKGLGIELNIEDLTELLKRIDTTPKTAIAVPEAMRGISGFSTTLLLKEILLDMHSKVYGKIRDYIFIDETKSGHLSVDVCIGDKEFFHWDIEIPDGEFSVTPRVPDPHRPLLDHKLGAKGSMIKVRNVYHRSLGSPNLTRLDDNMHQYYSSTDASCVDLFTQGPPPATFGELKEKDFCLGRCAHPMIINTGGG